jgi:3-oxoacid CoA-transferase
MINTHSFRPFVTISSLSQAISKIQSASTIAVGGFATSGVPNALLQALSERNLKELEIVSIDVNVEGYGIDHLISKKQTRRHVASYVGENPNLARQYLAGDIEVEFTPMGTLVEKLRAGGAGIPAFYTLAGANTVVSEGKLPIRLASSGSNHKYSQAKTITKFDGKDYVLENSITTEFGLIKAWKADTLGNLIYRGSSQNSNPLVATASKYTIAEVEEIVPAGYLDSSSIHTPSIYLDTIVHVPHPKKFIAKQPKSLEKLDDAKKRILKRAAKEFKPGMYVNLGIGLPTMVTYFIDPELDIILQAENGVLGVGPYPDPDLQDPDFINAGKEPITLIKGGSIFNSARSFGMIRGGHIDITILGALQVSSKGDLASWLVPGKLVKGMGGSMDLVSSSAYKVVTMLHTNKNQARLVEECNYPLTGRSVVDLLITEMGVFDFRMSDRMTLIEIGKDVTLEQIEVNTDCKFEVSSSLKEME